MPLDDAIGPDPIDIAIGARMRLRRKSLGISQGILSDRVGVSFQQIQKYERGANRVSGSMLVSIASALGAVMDGDRNVPDRTGNRHPALAMAPYNTYRCRDGYVAIFTSAERHWVSMCEMLGRQDLLTNPEFMTTPGRAKNMAVIDDMVGAWTLPKTKDEVLAALTAARVPCAPVKTAREVAYDPHLEARGFWVDVEHPRRGKTRVPISPIRLHTGGKSEIKRPAPTLGQDTDAVLGELLGLKADELVRLRADEVIVPVTERKKKS